MFYALCVSRRNTGLHRRTRPAGDAGFGIFGLVVLISFPTLLLFAGVCFALATIAENALMSKAVLESKYDFREDSRY